MVSMPSIHFYRWVNQLIDAEHEIYWFDVTGSGINAKSIDWVNQITNWKLRTDFIGRTFIKKRFPKLYNKIHRINERDLALSFEEELHKIEPDVVHSFALNVSCSPILGVMEKHSKLRWIYSSWGSDLFYFQNEPSYLKDIKKVLTRVNYMFTDCNRDLNIAEQYGFKGEFLGVFPGGGGYDLGKLNNQEEKSIFGRRKILIKGYQGELGRCIEVLKALCRIKNYIKLFEIAVLGQDSEVLEYVKSNNLEEEINIRLYGRLSHSQTMDLMQESYIYVGNSLSDGIPNTLLEAIVKGAFPIQSNPGGASAEIINDGVNGLLINNCEDLDEIKTKILETINNKKLVQKAYKVNLELRKTLDVNNIKREVLEKYMLIQENLK